MSRIMSPTVIRPKLSSLWQEFKAFAFKGSLIDLAVAVVLGKAVGDLIGSLVKNVFMPLLSYVIPGNLGYRTWKFGKPGGEVLVGEFIGDFINFLVVALAIFLFLVKLLGAVMKRVGPPPAATEPATKECPFCLSVIPTRAVKCAHCTADLPQVRTVPAAGGVGT